MCSLSSPFMGVLFQQTARGWIYICNCKLLYLYLLYLYLYFYTFVFFCIFVCCVSICMPGHLKLFLSILFLLDQTNCMCSGKNYNSQTKNPFFSLFKMLYIYMFVPICICQDISIHVSFEATNCMCVLWKKLQSFAQILTFVSSDRSSCSRPITTFSHNLLTLLKISL